MAFFRKCLLLRDVIKRKLIKADEERLVASLGGEFDPPFVVPVEEYHVHQLESAMDSCHCCGFTGKEDRELRPRRIECVVGFDFGTTFSGFACAMASGRDEIIRGFYDWPSGTEERPSCKALTALYYKRTELGELECASWGFMARSDLLASMEEEEPQGLYLSRFKLLSTQSDLPPPLTVDSIMVDYLRSIGEFALSEIRMQEGEADLVRWCVAVPSAWDENAKQRMQAWMVSAGLVSGGVKVVRASEAASFHCHEILRQDHKDVSLNPKDRVLIADVGGGTVDIVVQEVVRTGRAYEAKELTESSSGLCGGTALDESFLRFVAKKVPCLDEFLRNDLPSDKTRLLKDWEGHKYPFGHELFCDNETEVITLHGRLAKKWEEYETAQGLPPRSDGYDEIEMTQDDLKSIFDPVVDEILELIAAQLMQVPDIKVMFVVGGFGRSPYLKNRIQARFLHDVQHIVCPMDPSIAVCDGAVLLALRSKNDLLH